MIIEKGINPNCSELVVRLGNPNEYEGILENLKDIGLELVIAKDFWNWDKNQEDYEKDWDDDTDPRIIKISELDNEGKEAVKNYICRDRSKEVISEKLGEEVFDDRASITLSNGKEIPNYKEKEDINICLDEYDKLSIEVGDYDYKTFPIIKKISEYFNSYVTPYDGGSLSAYEEWLEENEGGEEDG